MKPFWKTPPINPKQWMRDELQYREEDYKEYGEINCTKLAEECANTLLLYADDYNATIPEEVFDIAFDVVEKWKQNE